MGRTLACALLVVFTILPLVAPEQHQHFKKNADKVYDMDHIKEHYNGEVDLDASKTSKEELRFHFFKQHDFNNDNKLDGLEMLQAFKHIIPYEADGEDHPADQVKEE